VIAPGAACPCGRLGPEKKPLSFDQCCGRWLGHLSDAAPDAESLMRSRYTAYVMGDEDYLLASWHASTRPAAVPLDKAAKWLGLEVRNHVVLDPTHAQVEFVARYRVGGRGARLHERSRFVREGGRWYYVAGDTIT
jgi:SEC-C motif domain protein